MSRLSPDDEFYNHLPAKDLSPAELTAMGIDGAVPVPDNGESGESITQPVRQVIVTAPEPDSVPEPLPLTASQSSYDEFMLKWGKAEVASKGVYVYGKKVQASVASKLAKDAVTTIRDEFTIFELVKLVSDGGLSLCNYFGTLKEIRDDPDTSAKDRMAANDKILNATLSITKTFAGREDVEELESLGNATRDKSDVESTKGLLMVLANVQGASQLPIEAGKHGSPTLTELVPEVIDADTDDKSKDIPKRTGGPSTYSHAPQKGPK